MTSDRTCRLTPSFRKESNRGDRKTLGIRRTEHAHPSACSTTVPHK